MDHLPQYLSLTQTKGLKLNLSLPLRDAIRSDILRLAFPFEWLSGERNVYAYDLLAFKAYDALEHLPQTTKHIDDVTQVQGIYFDDTTTMWEPEYEPGQSEGKEMPFPVRSVQFLYIRYSEIFIDRISKICWAYNLELADGTRVMQWDKRSASFGFEPRYWLKPLNLGQLISDRSKEYGSLPDNALFSIEELERVTGLPVEVTDDEVIRNPPSLRTSQKTTRGNDFLDQMRESWANYVARNHSIPTSSQLIQQLERDSITNDSIIVDRENRTISICDKKKDFGKSDFGFEQSYRRLKRELSDQ